MSVPSPKIATLVAWTWLAVAAGAPAAAEPPAPAAAEPPASAVRGAALELLNSPHESVRESAIRVLGRIGTAEDVPQLVRLAAASASDAEKTAASLALGGMRGREIDPTIIRMLATAEPGVRVVLIRGLADRRPPEALAAVLGQVADGDAAVRREAFKAITELADQASIPTLVGLLTKASPGPDRDALEQAIAAGCRRNPDPLQHATPLLTLLAGADATRRILVLPILGQMGGAEALAIIQAARVDGDEAVRQAAVRGLCNWPEDDVAPELLALAREPAKPEYRTWAVRALARVVPRAAREHPQQSATMLRETLALAEQPADKNLVLARMSAVRTPEALATALASTADPTLRDTAIKVVIDLARAMWTTHQPAAREALEKIGPLVAHPEIRAQIQRIIEAPDAKRKGPAT